MRDIRDSFIGGVGFAFGVAVAAAILKAVFHFQLLT